MSFKTHFPKKVEPPWPLSTDPSARTIKPNLLIAALVERICFPTQRAVALLFSISSGRLISRDRSLKSGSICPSRGTADKKRAERKVKKRYSPGSNGAKERWLRSGRCNLAVQSRTKLFLSNQPRETRSTRDPTEICGRGNGCYRLSHLPNVLTIKVMLDSR